MQDGFVGDVCDYGKYGLLRRVCHPEFVNRPLRLGMVWHFLNGQVKSKRSNYSYLRKPEEYCACDPELFRTLAEFSPNERTVANVQSSGRIFPPNTVFFDEPVPSGAAGRNAWFNRALASVEESEVVFVDPDNGVKNEEANSPKHVSWGEIRKLRNDGQRSVIVYQHLGQGGGGTGPYRDRIVNCIRTAREKMQTLPDEKVRALWLRRGSGVAFIMIVQKKHAETFERAFRALTTSHWGLHFCLVSS